MNYKSINIRPATKWDLNTVLDMLRNFRSQTPIEIMAMCDDETYMNKVYNHIISGLGVALIAEKDQQAVGMIMGVISPSLWDPNLYILNEMCLWVEPEHRFSTAGYKLIKAYGAAAEELKNQGRIKMYTMTKMVNSPDIDYGRFGYKKSEETWVGGI